MPTRRSNRPGAEPAWDTIIRAHRSPFAVPIGELWRYRELTLALFRRDFVVRYKQTILGPAWFLVQPLLTTVVFTVVFGQIAELSTDGAPQPLFYLAGQVLWTYFAALAIETSTVFLDNAPVFGKVYFPRLIVPISLCLSALAKFGLQLGLMLLMLLWFVMRGAPVAPGPTVLLLPFLLLVLTALSLGLGLVFAAVTTRYRDLRLLMQFGIQLLMYLSPIIYPVSTLSGPYRTLISLNPITPVAESFRHAFLGSGELAAWHLAYSAACAAVLLFAGVSAFQAAERTVMDTI